jgi:hypothetical protein
MAGVMTGLFEAILLELFIAPRNIVRSSSRDFVRFEKLLDYFGTLEAGRSHQALLQRRRERLD